MRRNAIARIVVFSLIALALTGILVAGLGGGLNFVEHHSGTIATGQVEIDPSRVSKLEITWAAGTVTVKTGDTDKILISEEGDFEEKDAMLYEIDEGTLEIYHSTGKVIGSSPKKNLTVTVPVGWECRELDLDAAGVEVTVEDLLVKSVDLDGAGMEFRFDGKLTSLDCDGAGCVLDIVSREFVESVEIDGAGCDVELTLPEGCGFAADMDGLGCSFTCNEESSRRDGKYVYGNENCKINADGLGVALSIHYGPKAPEPTATEKG